MGSKPPPAKPSLNITPPLLNSSNPWATSLQDLQALYACRHTGAVTTRTSLWKGFTQQAHTHQYTFFASPLGHATSEIDISGAEGRGKVHDGEGTSLNTLGYSPVPFQEYVDMLVLINRNVSQEETSRPRKKFIVSVTGTAEEVGLCASHLSSVMNDPANQGLDVMMEINLSCPNIVDKPPPAYDGAALYEYIAAVAEAKARDIGASGEGKYLRVGIKTPPYTYHGQFQTLISALESSTELEGGCPISFITATNTLGSCLVLNSSNEPALGSVSGNGIGGMAGDALHPLALGNVKTIRGMLDASPHSNIREIAIIGIGGVSNAAGYNRMMSVGATAVGVGTAYGREGVSVFEKILG